MRLLLTLLSLVLLCSTLYLNQRVQELEAELQNSQYRLKLCSNRLNYMHYEYDKLTKRVFGE